MSGVGEALAIVSCVAGLIQAYDAAARRIEKIKKTREQRKAPPPPIHLETSVERGKQQIVEVVKEGRERFGAGFEHGDAEVQIALLRITVATQAELLEGLAAGREYDDSVDFWGCIDASDNGRRQALVVLNEYIMRKTKQEREQAAMQRPEVLEVAIPVQTQEPHVRLAGQSPQPRQSDNVQRSPQRRPTEPTNNSTQPKRFAFLRSSTGAVESPPQQTAHQPPISAQTDQASLRPLHDRTWTGSTLVSNNSRRTTSSSITPPSISPGSPSIYEDAGMAYGGCCKYASYLREGKVSKSLGRQQIHFKPGVNFRCQSSKCTFQIPAIYNKKKDLVLDNRPRNWKGILQYTVVFLAKSHVPMQMPLHEQRTSAQYRCIICILFQEKSSIFRGHDSLFEHILSHEGAILNNLRLEGPLSFSNEGVSITADFDLNLPESDSSAVVPPFGHTRNGDAGDAEQLQRELEKLEMSSKRSSHTSQETDPFYCPWD